MQFLKKAVSLQRITVFYHTSDPVFSILVEDIERENIYICFSLVYVITN